MKYLTTSHRNAEIILEHDNRFLVDWPQVKDIIAGIYDGDIIMAFNKKPKPRGKSISIALNAIFKERLVYSGWENQPSIFQEPHLKTDSTWRLDFSKPKSISIEVAFNHGGSVAWNLIKPVLASNINLMKRETETEIGIIIAATQVLKVAGGFDNVVGSYQKYVQYLKPMNFQLTSPLMIVGLLPPRSFKIEQYRIKGKDKKFGRVRFLINFKRNNNGNLFCKTLKGRYQGKIYCFNKF